MTDAAQVSDVLIFGGGIAGASLAAMLAGRCKVTLLEAEDLPGRHATGRSAAMLLSSGEAPLVRLLVRESRGFFDAPPAGFSAAPLLRQRDALYVAGPASAHLLHGMRAEEDVAAITRVLSVDDACRRVPILRAEALSGAVLDESSADIDVDALLQGFLRMARRGGVDVVTGCGFEGVVGRHDGCWHVLNRNGRFVAPLLVNAAGAWADELARRAGVAPVGLQPLRRTLILVPGPEPAPGAPVEHWPSVNALDDDFYFKPETNQLMVSAGNEDPSLPTDAVPDELDVAVAADRFEQATTLGVRRVIHRWAGLRTFAPDRLPVVGPAPGQPGFFWLAGQGGFGVQTAPALATLPAAMILDDAVPDALATCVAAFAPARYASSRRSAGGVSAVEHCAGD